MKEKSNILNEHIDGLELEPEEKPSIRYIIAVFLIMLLVLMIIPYYTIKINPEPDHIPRIDEVLEMDMDYTGDSIVVKSDQDYRRFVKTDPFIRILSGKLINLGCKKQSKVCQAKVLYYFVQENFNYISDPVAKEYIEEPKLFINTVGGDCESGSIFLATLMESIGIDSQLVFIPGHAYIRIKLHEAVKSYKKGDGYIYLDWTCADCEFGEIPYTDISDRTRILEVP